MKPRFVSTPWGMALAALILFTLFNLISEKMPLGNGLGYDGVEYANIAKHFDKILDGTSKLGQLTFNRFLPSLLCRLTLLGLGLPLSDPAIIGFFTWYNVVLLTAGAWLWGALAGRAGISETGRWLGFVALFCSHAILKYCVYYPTITDVTAFSLGLLMLWAYLRGSDLALLAATLAGSATWPTLLPQGLLLLIFPRRPLVSGAAPRRSAALAAIVVGGLALRFLQRQEIPPPETLSLALGAGAEIVYFGLALFVLCNARALFSAGLLRASLSLPRLGLTGVLVAAVLLALWKLTGFPPDLARHGEAYIFQAIRLGMKFPAEFVVSHTLYFGPWVLVLMVLFARAAKIARQVGLGFVLLCIMTIAQSMTPLSRQLIAAVPFFVYLLVATLDATPSLPPRFWAWLAMLCLFFSKVWMHFSTNPDDPEKTFCFPWYVSSTGCWMSFPFYWIQGLIVFSLLVFFIFWLRPRDRLSRVS